MHAIVQVEDTEDFAVQADRAHVIGDGVHALAVVHREDAPERGVGEHRDLLANLLAYRLGTAARDDIGLHARLHQSLDAQLRGLALLLPEGLRLDDVRQGDEADRVLAFLKCQLAQGLDVEAVLVVTDGAADLNEDDIRGTVPVAVHRQLAQATLHLAGHVRDPLHIAPEIRALALPIDDRRENLAAGHEVAAGKILIQQTLVRAEIHVALCAVIEHEDLAVAERVERSGVDVEIALEFDGRNHQPLVLEQLGDAGGKDALAQAAHHRSENHDVLRAPLAIAIGHGREKLSLSGTVGVACEQVACAERRHIFLNVLINRSFGRLWIAGFPGGAECDLGEFTRLFVVDTPGAQFGLFVRTTRTRRIRRVGAAT